MSRIVATGRIGPGYYNLVTNDGIWVALLTERRGDSNIWELRPPRTPQEGWLQLPSLAACKEYIASCTANPHPRTES